MMAETTLPRTADTRAGGLPRRLASRIAFSTGWRRNGLALLLGLAAAAAMPPFNLVPLLIPAFTGLVWLIDGASAKRRAFFDGWLWSMGFLVPSLYWICLSMTVDLAQFWWMIPVTLLGLPAFLSLYAGGAALATRLVGGTGAGRILIFAACWVGFEWLRGHVPFGGFPWVLIGYAWSSDAPVLVDMLQAASLIGVYGLSLLTVLIAALPASLADRGMSRPYLPVLAGAILCVALIGWGSLRLAGPPVADVPGVTLRLVQTDLPNKLGESIEDAVARLRTVLATAETRGADEVTAQIWPESSAEFFLDRDREARNAIARAAPPDGVVLTGALLADTAGRQIWNSMAAIDQQGALVGRYEKAHLVPFGEYVPLYEWLKFVPIVAGRPGLATGPGAITLDLPHLPPVAPIICYEGIFAHAAVDEAHRPAWIVNITNDAWFGRSIGPTQHFEQARLRAVEEGLPLVRSANGGISGVVDPYGRRIVTLPLGTTAALDVKLPEALPEPTLYARFGDGLVLLMALVAFTGGLFLRGRFH
ncbi:MAG TPA: apolipoprotein N-acyltransferase [Aliidongia sp.]|nr:apolipoprotein N-acyltransferase [Aliidongia sp.]